MTETIMVRSGGKSVFKTIGIIFVVVLFVGLAIFVVNLIKPEIFDFARSQNTTVQMNEIVTEQEQKKDDGEPSKFGVYFWILFGLIALGGVIWFVYTTNKRGGLFVKPEETVDQLVERCLFHAYKRLQLRKEDDRGIYEKSKRGYNVEVRQLEKLKDSKGCVTFVKVSLDEAGTSFNSVVYIIRSDTPDTRMSWYKKKDLVYVREDLKKWQSAGYSPQKTDFKDEQFEQLMKIQETALAKLGEEE